MRKCAEWDMLGYDKAYSAKKGNGLCYAIED
jgi:hypothetical protein